MPVKRRRPKARADHIAAWTMVFIAGYDFFEDLTHIGVKTDSYGRPDLAEAREAWKRLGPTFLADYDEDVEPWAIEEFGMPGRRRR